MGRVAPSIAYELGLSPSAASIALSRSQTSSRSVSVSVLPSGVRIFSSVSSLGELALVSRRATTGYLTPAALARRACEKPRLWRAATISEMTRLLSERTKSSGMPSA